MVRGGDGGGCSWCLFFTASAGRSGRRESERAGGVVRNNRRSRRRGREGDREGGREREGGRKREGGREREKEREKEREGGREEERGEGVPVGSSATSTPAQSSAAPCS